MREKKNFAQRAKVLMSNEVKKKYFLVYEGKDTELLYFEAVEKLKEILQIDPLIELEQETILENIIEDVPKIIKYGALTYSEGFDKVCFIVDRDKNSFTTNQYEYVLKQCQKRKFGFYVTNPCFEFWLLMHFDDVKELDREQLLKNPIITAQRRYCEYELRKRLSGYKKSKYDAEFLVKKVDVAIKNEKNFCEDISYLKEKIGSNVGLLINELRRLRS